jgi:hypothetical protein
MQVLTYAINASNTALTGWIQYSSLIAIPTTSAEQTIYGYSILKVGAQLTVSELPKHSVASNLYSPTSFRQILTTKAPRQHGLPCTRSQILTRSR